MNITNSFLTTLPAYLARRIDQQGLTGEQDIRNMLIDFTKKSEKEIEKEVGWCKE